MVNFYFIRHGESKDNLRGVWAGWKDSPLSNHGFRQAEALGADLARIKISAIYSSDLKRAQTTAKTLKDRQPDPNVPHLENTQLREQNFGAGEGMKFAKKEKGLSLVAHYAKGRFPAVHSREERFPGGESLDDMASRAHQVIEEILLPHIMREREDGSSMNVAIVSHGLFIGELLAAIVKRDTAYRGDVDVRNLRGMKNTAWTRVEVLLKSEVPIPLSTSKPTELVTKITGVNRHPHLSNLHRQGGGIGSMAHDPSQQDIRMFLGKQKPAPEARPKPY